VLLLRAHISATPVGDDRSCFFRVERMNRLYAIPTASALDAVMAADANSLRLAMNHHGRTPGQRTPLATLPDEDKSGRQ
jgi:hypothetical protein